MVVKMPGGYFIKLSAFKCKLDPIGSKFFLKMKGQKDLKSMRKGVNRIVNQRENLYKNLFNNTFW